MLLGVLWDYAAEFCKVPLGVNPAHGLRKAHENKNPHEPWPAEVIEAFLNKASEPLRLALYLLLFTGRGSAMWLR